MGERDRAVLSFLTREMAAGLSLLLLRVSSGSRQTLAGLVSNLLGGTQLESHDEEARLLHV